MAGSSVTPLPSTGRDWMLRRFEFIERKVAQILPSVTKSVNGIVEGLQAAVNNLAATQAELSAAQTELAATQSDLAAAQAMLVSTQSFQVETSGGFGVTSSYVAILSQNINVPAEYTKVDLVTIGFASAVTNSTTSTFFRAVVAVNGSAGASAFDGPVSSTAADSTASVSIGDARTIAGVSGSTIAIELRVKKDSGADWATSSSSAGKLSILAIFHN